MKETLQTGLETTAQFTVDTDRITRHMGDNLGVYATPALLRDIEHTCHDLLQEHLAQGEDSVGTRIDLQHLAPTLEGVQVTVHARIIDVDRRAVTFAVDVHDEFEELARCTHGRFVVDRAKLKERLASKAARIRSK
jgi:fluoroacetyl-CoA thioesterase